MSVPYTITRCMKIELHATLDKCRRIAKKLGFSIRVRTNGWFRYQLVKNKYDVFGLAWGNVIALQEALEEMMYAKKRGWEIY